LIIVDWSIQNLVIRKLCLKQGRKINKSSLSSVTVCMMICLKRRLMHPRDQRKLESTYRGNGQGRCCGSCGRGRRYFNNLKNDHKNYGSFKDRGCGQWGRDYYQGTNEMWYVKSLQLKRYLVTIFIAAKIFRCNWVNAFATRVAKAWILTQFISYLILLIRIYIYVIEEETKHIVYLWLSISR